MRALRPLSGSNPQKSQRSPGDSWVKGFCQRDIQIGVIAGTPSLYGAEQDWPIEP